jgi:hypothetical protein
MGYSRPDKVTRIFDKHKAEFTESMSTLVMIETAAPQNGGVLMYNPSTPSNVRLNSNSDKSAALYIQ